MYYKSVSLICTKGTIFQPRMLQCNKAWTLINSLANTLIEKKSGNLTWFFSMQSKSQSRDSLFHHHPLFGMLYHMGSQQSARRPFLIDPLLSTLKYIETQLNMYGSGVHLDPAHVFQLIFAFIFEHTLAFHAIEIR